MYEPIAKKIPAVAHVALLFTVLVSACTSPTQPETDLDPGAGVALPGGSTLLFQDGGRLAAQRPPIEEVVRETLARVRPLLPVDGVTIFVQAGNASTSVIPEIGIGGRADRGAVRLTFDPESPFLAASIEAELSPMLAHELHHVARIRAIGYGNHLLGAMISEGLADQFAVEAAGIDPPLWSTALDSGQLATWTSRAREQWFDAGYDHSAWFFGTGEIPRWAGYTIGFRMTGEFLAAAPSRRASTSYAEPASSFVPAMPEAQ